MPSATGLIALAFASGTAEQNRAMLERFAASHQDLPLHVVAEFEPHLGEWIPWHVYRTNSQNRAALRAAIGACTIEAAAMALARGTAFGPMRVAAVRLARRALVAYDEQLNPVRLEALPLYYFRQTGAAWENTARRWLRRIAHPRESEIPLRARIAQVRGIVANRARRRGKEAVQAYQAQVTMPGVTVVIPSRDGRDLLAAMLPALLPQLTQGEVIVCDNGSSDGTAAWLARQYPALRVIQSPAPLSFARAVNGGIFAARHERTLLLNNDMLVEPGFVAALEDAFQRIPGLYCATAQIFFPPGVRREETGKAVWRRENPLDFPMRCDDPHLGEDLTWVFYGSGGCSLFDTAKLRELGGVSEIYEPAYVEDMDFGYRGWKRGWPSVFCAGARVEHRHRATTARFFSPRQLDFFVERNYLRFLINAVGDTALFETLWLEGIRRLQLLAAAGSEAALDTLRDIPRIGPRPRAAAGALTEREIFALGNGDIACFPGRQTRGRRTILIASPYLPYPLSHGGAVRIFNLMKQAATDFDLVLVAFRDALHTPPAELRELCCEVVMVRRHGTHYRRSTPRPDVVEEFDSETFRACLKQTAERWKPAVLQLEFTWMAQYAGACPQAKCILVEHDITFDLQEQLLHAGTEHAGAEHAGAESGAARWELEQQAQKWRSYETRAWKEVDCVVTMSARDTAMVAGAKSVVALPNGVDCVRFQPSASLPEPRRLLFIGAFRHLPNLLALEYLLRDVWPHLRGTVGRGGAFALHIIAGPDPESYLEFHRHRLSANLLQLINQPGVELEGFVADVRSAYERAELVLAPLTASAGTNIKVLEAMAMGRAVISTPAGINGLELAPGEDVLVESGAEAFADAIRALSADPDRRRSIERHARATALRNDWTAIGQRQAVLYHR